MAATIQELNKKIWYRALKVFAILLLTISFVAGLALGGLIGGIFNILIYLLVIFLVRATILYIVYGSPNVARQPSIKIEVSPEEMGARTKELERTQRRAIIFFLSPFVVVIIISILLSLK